MATVTVDYSNVSERLQALLRRLKNPRAWLNVIAEELYRVARGSFEQQQSPEGDPWAPLKEPYATVKQAKYPNRQILQASRRMFRSLRRGVEGNRAFVQTLPLPYAAAHQFGSTHMIPALRAKPGKALRFFTSAGEAVFARGTRAHPVTIPARPFLGFPPDAQERVVAEIEEALAETMNE